MSKIFVSFFTLMMLMGTAYASDDGPIFDFGQSDISQPNGCINSECEIVLNKEFTTKPLIFLMPTITDNGRDAPSSLKITRIYKKGNTYAFGVRQVYPKVSSSIHLEDEDSLWGAWSSWKTKWHHFKDKTYTLYRIPMRKITYFAMEKGTIALGNNGRITAAELTVNKQLDGDDPKFHKGKKGDIDYKKLNPLIKDGKVTPVTIPSGFKNKKLGGIAQIQPRNKPSAISSTGTESEWLTPFIIRGSINDGSNHDGHFYLGVDSSETGYELNENVAIGYLLVEGSGLYKGLQFTLGPAETPNTLKGDYEGIDKITKPVIQQCAGFTDLKGSDFDFSAQSENPILVLASKNSRLGPNGGWIRLCKNQQKPGKDILEVSFVNDEDLNEHKNPERQHANEIIGFMAFQRRASEEVCNLFPGPAQTWETSGGKFEGTHNVVIKGAAIKEGKRYIGFNTIEASGGPNNFCNGEECHTAQPYPSLFAKKQVLDTWPAGDDGNLESQRDFGDQTLFWFNSINLSNKNIIFPTGSVVHVKKMSLTSSTIKPLSGIADDLFIIVHDLEPSDVILHDYIELNNGSQITGLVYSERNLTMSDGLTSQITSITGAITAPNIKMTGDVKNPKTAIIGSSVCFDPEPEPEFELTITPTEVTKTLCHAQQVDFNVTSEGGTKEFDGDITVNISSSTGGIWADNSALASSHKFTAGTHTFKLPAKNQHAVIWVLPNGAETLKITASIEFMAGDAPEGNYTFIPGGLSIGLKKGHNIVAGEPFDATIKAMTCLTGSNIKPIENYSGTKLLDFSTQYQAPKKAADPDDPITVEIVNGKHIDPSTGATKQAKVEFTNGESEALTLRYRDAGIISWHVSDPNCTSESCTLTAKNSKETKLLRQQLPEGLTGSVTINSRPWMFAICPLKPNSANELDQANGTAESGDGYIAAGLPFNVLLKPLVWKENKVKHSVFDVSKNYCSYPVTENFLAPDAPAMGSGLLTQTRLATPDGGAKGKFTQGKMTVEPTLKGLLLSGNTWSEVGSIWLQVGMNDYIEKGNDIEQSQRQIGRFYPHYFAFTDSSKVTPAIGDFTYMDQPFDASFTINAFNAANDPVKNYGLFASNLQSQFDLASGNYESGYLPLDARLKQVNSDESLVTPSVSQWNPTSSEIIFAPYKLMFQRNGTGTTTTEDGPYHQWQLRVKQKTPWPDNATWSGEDVDQNGALVGKNDLRYGRMVLESVGGDMSKPLAVPLRVEYWDGTEFVENSDDSSSQFNGANYCRQIVSITPSDAKSAAKTSGSGSIVAGKALSGRFMAQPSDIKGYGIDSKIPVYKQQVRLWQRLDNSKPRKQDKNIECFGTYIAQPWLRYNWRQLGDEDPSAIITFGVYRGNDRILYRDEPGIPATDYQ
ncbi:conserved hypothetical protein [Photobacterium leiognathi lrivu.4.1]|uniref:DUF6701 domain-containing protein n=1 Tax=Photobacterium leiognathi lrivu.4.1 TaxID=1248232 RepID=A0A0U1P861_PHOLE|nr:DUF6701 domain-containing protein [Photobacterium leiognathi]GAD30926.1 conserved hypothetical protein [Photobacterium leiognathi lrivu.4.1]